MKNSKTINIFNIMAIFAIIIFCFAISPITLQNDTFYTIKIGEYILQNGIDMQDPFSWHEGLAYTYPHWGYDVAIYLIYSLFGMTGIYISTCLLASILGLSMYAINCKLAKNHVISFFITIGSIYMLGDYIAARAQLVTFILFIFTIYFIEKFLETKKKRYAAGLIIIPIIIANIHAAVWPFYFVLFLPYIGEYVIALITDIIMERKYQIFMLKRKIIKHNKKGNAEEVLKLEEKLENLKYKIEKAKEKRAEEKKNSYKLKINRNDNVKWLIIIMLVCVFTGLLTPIGDTPYTYLIKTMQGNTTQNINEHLPMTLIENEQVMCLLILYIALLTFTKIKIQLKDLFMIGGLAFLMFYSRRQSTMFILIGSITINKMTYEALKIYTKNFAQNLTKRMTTKVGVFVTIAIILTISLNFANEKKNDEFINTKDYPVAAADYILENLDVNNIKIYNDYNYGSYLIYRDIPVFIDSRADLYAPEFNTPTGNPDDGKDIFMDFINVSSIATYYDTMFDNYEMTHILTTKNSKLAMLIDKREDTKYNKIYNDDDFVLYEIIR